MSRPVIAVIGAGHMGSSLIGGLIRHGQAVNRLLASDVHRETLQALEKQFHITTTSNNIEAAEKADVIILAIKPQFFAQVAEELASLIQQKKPLVISIAAGVSIANMEKCFGKETAIVRTMPNTPALIGLGATALFANAMVLPAQKEIAQTILEAVGMTVWLEKESWMDVVTALSGSGPAYFFLIMEALQKSAQELGLPENIAKCLTLQTALGAAEMAKTTSKSLETLRHEVTSPKGTTEKAIYVLEEHNIRDTLHQALQAAKLRSEELAKQF